MNRKFITWALTAGALLLLTLTAANYAFYNFLCMDCNNGLGMSDPYLLRPEGSLRVDLEVRPESPQRVLAYVTFTNATEQDVWLYKPLLCAEGYSEEVFYVQTPDSANLDYQGKHEDEYIGGQPGPLPMVLPREVPDLYVKVAPGATHTTTVNLAELFDFEHHRGHFTTTYLAYMPVMQDGKHVHESDGLKMSTNRGPVPVYYIVEPGFGKKIVDQRIAFEVK